MTMMLKSSLIVISLLIPSIFATPIFSSSLRREVHLVGNTSTCSPLFPVPEKESSVDPYDFNIRIIALQDGKPVEFDGNCSGVLIADEWVLAKGISCKYYDLNITRGMGDDMKTWTVGDSNVFTNVSASDYDAGLGAFRGDVWLINVKGLTGGAIDIEMDEELGIYARGEGTVRVVGWENWIDYDAEECDRADETRGAQVRCLSLDRRREEGCREICRELHDGAGVVRVSPEGKVSLIGLLGKSDSRFGGCGVSDAQIPSEKQVMRQSSLSDFKIVELVKGHSARIKSVIEKNDGKPLDDSPNDTNRRNGSLSAGAIVGIAVGALVVVGFASIAVFHFARKVRSSRSPSVDDGDDAILSPKEQRYDEFGNMSPEEAERQAKALETYERERQQRSQAEESSKNGKITSLSAPGQEKLLDQKDEIQPASPCQKPNSEWHSNL